jgi:hypothetical protein
MMSFKSEFHLHPLLSVTSDNLFNIVCSPTVLLQNERNNWWFSEFVVGYGWDNMFITQQWSYKWNLVLQILPVFLNTVCRLEWSGGIWTILMPHSFRDLEINGLGHSLGHMSFKTLQVILIHRQFRTKKLSALFLRERNLQWISRSQRKFIERITYGWFTELKWKRKGLLLHRSQWSGNKRQMSVSSDVSPGIFKENICH